MINAAVQYRRALKKKLRCGRDVKNRLLESFDSTLSAYLEEHPDPNMDDLTIAFGPPVEMAEVLMTEVTPQEKTQYRKNSTIHKILIALLAAFLLFSTIYIWFYKETALTSTDSIYEATNGWDESYTPITEVP